MDRLRNFGFLLKDISRLHARNFERLGSGLNLSLAQCKVLAHLERHEGLSQARMAELADADPMTLLRTIDRMERDGWVERRADPNDRRAYRLFLTPAASPVLERMWAIADASREQALAGLSAEEHEQLFGLLGRIQGNLTVAMSTPAEPLPAPTEKQDSARRSPTPKGSGRSKSRAP